MMRGRGRDSGSNVREIHKQQTTIGADENSKFKRTQFQESFCIFLLINDW